MDDSTKDGIGDTTVVPYDPAVFLDTEEGICLYIEAALEDAQETGSIDCLLEALNAVARARNMTRLAEQSGLGRVSLYKALQPGAQPRFETILKICNALGVSITTAPLQRNAHG